MSVTTLLQRDDRRTHATRLRPNGSVSISQRGCGAARGSFCISRRLVVTLSTCHMLRVWAAAFPHVETIHVRCWSRYTSRLCDFFCRCTRPTNSVHAFLCLTLVESRNDCGEESLKVAARMSVHLEISSISSRWSQHTLRQSARRWCSAGSRRGNRRQERSQCGFFGSSMIS